MKRIALMVLRLFYAAPFWFYKICKYAKDESFKKYTREERYRFLQYLTKRATKAGRIDIVSTGLENIPKEDGFVVFPNHQGLFDGLVFFQTLGRPFATIMKKETKDIILLKQVRILVGGIDVYKRQGLALERSCLDRWPHLSLGLSSFCSSPSFWRTAGLPRWEPTYFQWPS